MIKKENLSCAFDNECDNSIDILLENKQDAADYAVISNIIKRQNSPLDAQAPLLSASFANDLFAKLEKEKVHQVKNSQASFITKLKGNLSRWGNPLIMVGSFIVATIGINSNISGVVANNEVYSEPQTIPYIVNGTLKHVSFNPNKVNNENNQDFSNKINQLFNNHINNKRSSNLKNAE